MTGWRLGYLIGDAELLEKVAQFQEHTVTCANSITQYALWYVLRSGEMDQVVALLTEEFRQRREIVHLELQSLPRVEISPMEGTFYSWIKIIDLAKTSQSFASQLLEEQAVMVVPGSVFGESGEGYVRLCYARAGGRLFVDGA
jgi:aspartate/methionine/tyrosine aminotransferase